jgi:hypothetical protein
MAIPFWLKIVGPAVLFALSSCGEKRIAVGLRPDIEHGERFVCERVGTRPEIPPEYVIDWTKVRTVAEAKAQHEKFVGVLRTREGIVAGYLLELEHAHLICWNNMQWQRDYYSKMPASGGGSAALGRDPPAFRHIGSLRTPDGKTADLTVSV